MILLTKTAHLLKCAYYQSYGGQLCFRITDLILVQSKCLEVQKTRERDSKAYKKLKPSALLKGTHD